MTSKLDIRLLTFVILLTVGILVDGHCFKNKNCHACTRDDTWTGGACLWCPLDRACHAKWSPKNHCVQNRSIRDVKKCPPKKTKSHRHYDYVKAYKLSLFSAMAYSDTPEKCLNAIYPRGNYTDMYVDMQQCDGYLFEYDKQCLSFVVVDHIDSEIIVSYRGTRGAKQILDQVLTILGTPKVASMVGGKVQRYFQNVYDNMEAGIENQLKAVIQKYPDYTVAFTGHSLGGAAASIATATMVKRQILPKDKVSLYTFGMPRVGNKIYAEAFDKLVPNSWRVVRDGDMVTRFPMCHLARCSGFNGPYHHKTKVLYTGSTMTMESRYTICNGNEDSKSRCKSRGRHRRGVFPGVTKAHKNYFGIPIGTFCVDHVLKPT